MAGYHDVKALLASSFSSNKGVDAHLVTYSLMVSGLTGAASESAVHFAAAVDVCKESLSAPTAAEAADAANSDAARNNPSSELQAPGNRKKACVSLNALRKQSAMRIFDESTPKLQGMLAGYLADSERDRIEE